MPSASQTHASHTKPLLLSTLLFTTCRPGSPNSMLYITNFEFSTFLYPLSATKSARSSGPSHYGCNDGTLEVHGVAVCVLACTQAAFTSVYGSVKRNALADLAGCCRQLDLTARQRGSGQKARPDGIRRTSSQLGHLIPLT